MMKNSRTNAALQKEAALIQLEDGRKYLSQNDLARAKRCFRHASQLDPTNPQVWLHLASLSEGDEKDHCFQKAQECEQHAQEARQNGPQRGIEKYLQPLLAHRKPLFPVLLALAAVNIVVIIVAVVVWFSFDPSMSSLYQAGQAAAPKVFSTSSGGSIDLPAARFYVPPDALLGDEEFSMRVLSEAPAYYIKDPSAVAIGLPVQIASSASTLRQPSEVMLRYDRSRLPQGVSERSLQVARWEAGHWVFLDSAIDLEKQEVRAAVSHFSSPVLQMFGHSQWGISPIALEFQNANQRMEHGEYPQAAEAFRKIARQYEGKLKQLNKLDRSKYWLAYYDYGLALYQQGSFQEAGQVFLDLYQKASKEDAEFINLDGSGPEMALTSLENWYSLGIDTIRYLRQMPLLAEIPDQELYSRSDSKVAFYQNRAAYDALPQEILDYLGKYEAQYGGKDSIVTDSKVDVIIVPPQFQTSFEEYKDVFEREIKPYLSKTLVSNKSIAQSLEVFQSNLQDYVLQYSVAGFTSSSYSLSPEEVENPGNQAPLILLRIERQWQSDKRHYGQYLIAFTPTEYRGIRPLSSPPLTEQTIRFSYGKLSSNPLTRAWSVVAAYYTDDVQNQALDTKNIQASMLSAGGNHTCALSGGGVVCWGANNFGQLGSPTTQAKYSAFPVAVDGLATGVKAIASGDAHTCALNDQGAVYCWGRNDSGQLGDGTTIQRNTPVKVIGLSQGIISIVAGQNHSCALYENGSAWCWGSNFNGQIGNNREPNPSGGPVRAKNLEGVEAITAGANHTCALTNEKKVFCWGANTRSQLGIGSQEDQPAPVEVVGLKAVRQVSAGFEHTCALAESGLYCWGYNAVGQLGNGSYDAQGKPALIRFSNAKPDKVASGYNHTCALFEDGRVACWGNNVQGQLGMLAESRNSSQPVFLNWLSGPAVDLSAGGAHSCAMINNGDIQCWGGNTVGQLGGGSENKTDQTKVIGFGGLGPGAPNGDLVVAPVIGDAIEMGSQVQVTAKNLTTVGDQNSIKKVTLSVSVNSGDWQALPESALNGNETSIVWDTIGKELGTRVVFKMEIEDQFGNHTTRSSREYRLADTIKPNSPTVSVVSNNTGKPPESSGSKIEMGDWVNIYAKDVADNLNGSGVESVNFKVVENGHVIDMLSKHAQPYEVYWPVPKDMQKNRGDEVRFIVEVLDKAGNVMSSTSTLYTLVDTTNPEAGSLMVVEYQKCSDAQGSPIDSCVEYGSTVKFSIDKVADNPLGSGIASVKVEVQSGGSVISTASMAGAGNMFTGKWDAQYSPYQKYDKNITFEAVVTDQAGNTKRIPLSGYSVADTIAPVCDGLEASDTDQGGKGIVLPSELLTFKFTVKPDTGSALRYEIKSSWVNNVKGSDPSSITGTAVVGDDNTTGVKAEGVIVDAAENTSKPCLSTQSFKLNKQLMSVTGYVPSNSDAVGENTTIEIHFSAGETPTVDKGGITVVHGARLPSRSEWDSAKQAWVIVPPSNGWQGEAPLSITINSELVKDSVGSLLVNTNLTKTYPAVVNTVPTLITSSLSPADPLKIQFSELVVADPGWADLKDCPAGVGPTSPVEAAVETQTLSFPFSGWKHQPLDTCKLVLHAALIHDHDTPSKPFLSGDVELGFVAALIAPPEVTAWNQIKLNFSGKVTAKAGWAEWSSACSSMTLSPVVENSGITTLTINFKPGSQVDALNCSFRLLGDFILDAALKVPAVIPANLPLAWDFPGLPKFNQIAGYQPDSPFTVSFSRPVTIKAGSEGIWAVIDSACAAAGASLALSNAEPFMITVNGLSGLKIDPNGPDLPFCTITVLKDSFIDAETGLNPAQDGVVNFNVPAFVVSDSQTGNEITVRISEPVTAPSTDWAVWDASSLCNPKEVTLTVDPVTSATNKLIIKVDPGESTAPTCKILLVREKIFDGNIPAVMLQLGYPAITYTLPVP